MADLLPPPIANLLSELPNLPREILVPGGSGPVPTPAPAAAPDAALPGVPQPPEAAASDVGETAPLAALPTPGIPAADSSPAVPAAAGLPIARTDAGDPPAMEPAAADPVASGGAPAPTHAPPPPAAFPSLAALEAILDAIAATPRPAPTAEERAAMLAVFGLDPALADDPMAFEAALRNAPAADPDALLDHWLSEAGAVPPEPDPFPVAPDWLLG
jgi:hypothetical protein